MKQTTTFGLTVTETTARCPVGEATGQRNTREAAIPVLSCEGACIRGEIARLAAHRVAKMPGYRRGCHGELFAVPDSAMATWVRGAEQVVVIDGCPLKCHARIVEHLVPAERLRRFNALARYQKYTDVFDIDAVPEAERNAIADQVAAWVHGELETRSAPGPNQCAADAGAVAAPPLNPAPAATGCTRDADTAARFSPQVGALVPS